MNKQKIGITNHFSALEITLAVMAIASLILISLPAENLRREITINPQDHPATLVNDAHSGGDSRVIWRDRQQQRWLCQLGGAYNNPYCSIQISVTDEHYRGIDLSRYDTMTLWADYQGDAKHLRIYLRNRHPDYHNPQDGMSTKYNVIEVPTERLAQGFEMRMSDFSVANWWLVQRDIPLALSQPEFNDISVIEMQTGSEIRSGTHEVQLKKIAWSGPVITQTALYQGVIILWSIIIFGFLILRMAVLKRKLNQQQEYQRELLAINALLNLENRRFEDLAKTDALTGLPNRVGIRDMLYQGLADWREHKTPFSFMMIDLDNFKQINDSHGHDWGDRVLRDTAATLRQHVRRTDGLARWGGEEFILVCPDTDLPQALHVAENLRIALEHARTPKGTPVTASFGVASMTEANLDHLFKRADAALYEAKKRGRNRIYCDLYDKLQSA